MKLLVIGFKSGNPFENHLLITDIYLNLKWD